MSDVLSRHAELVHFDNDDLKFQTPCSICISGPSQSGKSEWIVRLINNRDLLFQVNFTDVYYCVPDNLCFKPNPIFERLKSSFPRTQIHYGLPDITKLNLNFDNTPKLLIIVKNYLGGVGGLFLKKIRIGTHKIVIIIA